MSRKLPDDYSYRDRHIPLGELLPHPKLQRRFRKAHAERILSEMDPAAIGLIWVQDKNGKFYVIDGQHRVWAVMKWLDGDKRPELLCRVFTNMSDEEAARITRKVNVTKAWQALDTFTNRLVEKDATALAVHKALASFGLTVSKSRGENVVQSVTACERAFLRLGEADFHRAIGILHGAWAGNPDAYTGAIVEGIALLINRHNGNTDTADLTKKLAKSGGPERLIGMARQAMRPLGLTGPHAMAHTLTVEYNKGRRVNKLPDWKRVA
jgi:hypothetical protein